MDKTKKRKGFRFAKAATLASFRRIAAELNDTCLLRMQLKREPPQSFTKLRKKLCGIALMLKPNDAVVSVAHDHDVTLGVARTPLIGPEIERIMKVNVREQRRNYRALGRAFRRCGEGRVNRWRIAEGTYKIALGRSATDFDAVAEATLPQRLFGV
jgi:hypothetical protein